MIKDIAYFSQQGQREVNQDSIYASAKEGRGIFVVADGMGGHYGGELASGFIVTGIRHWWLSNDFTTSNLGIDQVTEQCCALLTNINSEVFAYFEAQAKVGGSTVVVLILWDNRYAVLSVGDSRIYRAKDRRLEQLTTDDVWENLPEVKYTLSKEMMESDSRYGKLTEALGSDANVKISRGEGIISDDEVFLLCSDGIYKYCTQKELEKILFGGWIFKNTETIADKLRKCAEKNQTQDNYSAIVCVT